MPIGRLKCALNSTALSNLRRMTVLKTISLALSLAAMLALEAEKLRSVPVPQNWHELWQPRERIPVSVWADRYRVLTGGAEPGPWRTARVPYAAGPMDAFTEPGIRLINWVKSARVCGTEFINNVLGFATDQEPGPGMFVYPTEDAAVEECRDRIQKAVEASSRWASHIPHDGWATNHQLSFDTMELYMAWAKSPGTLIRRTARYVLVDELDNCDMAAGKLGNTLSLCEERVTTYKGRAKIVVVTTPTTPERSAWQTWEKSDRRKYHVPCPLCGAYQVLIFDRLRVPDGMRDPNIIRSERLAWYDCEICGQRLRDHLHKEWMVARGVWVKSAQMIVERMPIADPEIVERAEYGHPDRWVPTIEGVAPVNDIAGFHIWSAYSPWRTWSEIVAKWFAVKDDRETLRVFINSWLGEPFSETAEELQEVPFAAKREGGLPRGSVPDAALCIIVSADVQKNRIYYVVRAWGTERRSWLIEEGIVADLDELLAVALRIYPRQKDPKETIQADWLAIDSGYRTFEIYDFARTNPGIMAMKGKDTAQLPVFETNIEYVPPNKREMAKCKLFHVDTSYFKEQLVFMAGIPAGQPGEWNLNRDTSSEYCKQVTSEHQVWVNVKRNNRKVRIKKWDTKREGADNHFLDCEVYNLAAAHHRGILKAMQEAPKQAESEKPPEPREWGRKPMGWWKKHSTR